MTPRALIAAIALAPLTPTAIGATSPGLYAQWSTGTNYANKLGHIDWEHHDETSVVPAVNFVRTNAPFFDGGPRDHFAARMVGRVEVPGTGAWTFTLESDQGAQLFIDGELVISDADPHAFRAKSARINLVAGSHDIEVRYFESTADAGLVLSWAGPGVARQVIPAEAFSHSPEQAAIGAPRDAGVRTHWHRNLQHTTNAGQVDWSTPDRVATEQRIAFPMTRGSFAAGEAPDFFGARFMAVVDIDEAGEWSFELGSDQSAELLIDGVPVISDQPSHAFRWKTGSVKLSEGEHTVEVRYWEGNSAAGLYLAWQSPSDEHPSIIPSAAFRPAPAPEAPAAGEGLTAYWYNNTRHAATVGQVDWSRYDRVDTVQKLYWPLTNAGFDAGAPQDYFAARFTGYIDVPESGRWTFNLGSDQSARLFIDNKMVVDDSTAHTARWRAGTIDLPAGKHPIEVQYLEGWSAATLALTWTPPGSDREEVVPASAFSPRAIDEEIASDSGLRVYWVNNARHAERVGHVDFSRYTGVTETPNIAWGVTAGAFEDGQPDDYVALRAVGRITIPMSGVWKFGLGSDQSARMFIDGKLVVDDAASHPYRWRTGAAELAAGTYDIEVQHWEGWSTGALVATWTPPGGTEEVIPSAALSRRDVDPPFDTTMVRGSGGLRAYWSHNARHAENVGQVDWTSPDRVTTVENVAFPLSSSGFDAGAPADSVGVRLLGRINVPADGAWTFSLGSDQSAVLLINDQPVVVDAAGHRYRWKSGRAVLSAGWHDIEIQHWEGWEDAGLNLAWAGPGVPEQLVPRGAFQPRESEGLPAASGGIRAFVTTNASHAEQAGHIDHARHDATAVVDRLSFGRGTEPLFDGAPDDTYGVRFLARLNVPQTGAWTFGLGSDQSAVLLIDGDPIVADAEPHGYRWQRGSVQLTQGEHRIEVLYLEGTGEQGLHVTWKGPGDPVEQIIPAHAFALYEGGIDPGADCDIRGLRAEWINTDPSHSLLNLDWASVEPDAVTNEARVSWGRDNASYAPGINADRFAVRVTGTIDVPYEGEWTFGLGSDEQGYLKINGKAVVSDLSQHGFRWRRGTVLLPAGRHAFEAAMLDTAGEHSLLATWQGPADPYERIIPACAFGDTTRVRVVRTLQTTPPPGAAPIPTAEVEENGQESLEQSLQEITSADETD